MAQGLTYADAVRLLGGASPLVKAADNVLGGGLTLATAGGSDVALSLFDAKAEVIRLGHHLAGALSDVVRGLGRYERSRRLQAAHCVLVVTAFFEALEDCLGAAGVGSPGFTRDDQIALAAGIRAPGDVVGRLLAGEIPVPAPERTFDELVTEVRHWSEVRGSKVLDHLTGLAVWDEADHRARRAVGDLLRRSLPERVVDRYESAVRRLSEELPEFALWMSQVDARAVSRGLERLEAALQRVTSHRDPLRRRAALAAVYRAELRRPVFRGDVDGLVLPALGDAYVDPLFRVKSAGPRSRPADEDWWDARPRGDLAGFLTTYLTTPQAADAPLLLLGQPGAGKSSLTYVLAARLPAADFLVVRVALREVRAEAEIQDQVEQALRGAVGETVAWTDLAGDAGAAMPVVLLDGFDELLQATGTHQSDYLQRVATFQRREALLERPVAVVVTSRVAVADRARLPEGSLAVRLEPFDELRIARWLDVWNDANPGVRQLPVAALRRVPDLASQPLLLLLLALYDAASGALQTVDEVFDTGQLYERLLREFAGREVRRVHPGRPEGDLPELVEAELLRLSVVALAMFQRQRLWAAAGEIDADLTELGLAPAQVAQGFRTPLTAGQEMIGRFFFIQRAQAVRDGETLQTYEFLHPTFGEYLVARLVVQAVRDAAGRARARSLRLGPFEDDDLLRSLLSCTALTARTTVLPFATAMLRRQGSDEIRKWIVDRLQAAAAQPQFVTDPAYQPVDRRPDHAAATYSLNLLLLALACGGQLCASEVFPDAADPAQTLGDLAWQWRAAVPAQLWTDALATMTITREWTPGDRRELVLAAAEDDFVEDVEPFWAHDLDRSWELRSEPGSSFSNFFPLGPALKSMQLTATGGEDALRHALDPLLNALPETVTAFVIHGHDDAESVAHGLLQLWLTSTLEDELGGLRTAYERLALAVSATWVPPDEPDETVARVIGIVLRTLARDAGRLPSADLLQLVQTVLSSPAYRAGDHLVPALDCLLADQTPLVDERDLVIDQMLHDLPPFIRDLRPDLCLRLLTGLARTRSAAAKPVLAAIDALLESASFRAQVPDGSELALRLEQAQRSAETYD